MKSALLILCLTLPTLGLVVSANEMETVMSDQSGKLEVATFAGGCFWCVESDFEKVDGVTKVVSGYTGGEMANPNYKQVCSGTSGHLEAVQVFYDPERISYSEVLDVFWRHIDPTKVFNCININTRVLIIRVSIIIIPNLYISNPVNRSIGKIKFCCSIPRSN